MTYQKQQFMKDYQRGMDSLFLSAPTFANFALALGIPVADSESEHRAYVSWDREKKQVNFNMDPKYLATLDDDEIGAVIAHETYHVLLNHFAEKIDVEKYPLTELLSIAHECIINDGLESNVGLALPEDVMYGEPYGRNFAYDSTEDAYEFLKEFYEVPEMEVGGTGEGSDSDDSAEDSDSDSSEDEKTSKSDVEDDDAPKTSEGAGDEESEEADKTTSDSSEGADGDSEGSDEGTDGSGEDQDSDDSTDGSSEIDDDSGDGDSGSTEGENMDADSAGSDDSSEDDSGDSDSDSSGSSGSGDSDDVDSTESVQESSDEGIDDIPTPVSCGGAEISEEDLEDIAEAIKDALSETASKSETDEDELQEILDEASQEYEIEMDFVGVGSGKEAQGAQVSYVSDTGLAMNWENLLARINPEIKSHGRARQAADWMTPSRRMYSVYPDVILPTQKDERVDASQGDALPTLLIFVDISGSIPAWIPEKAVEMAITAPEDKIYTKVFTFDSYVHEVDKHNPILKKGGGTDFYGVVAKIHEEKKAKNAEVYSLVITDFADRLGFWELSQFKEVSDNWFWMDIDDRDYWTHEYEMFWRRHSPEENFYNIKDFSNLRK